MPEKIYNFDDQKEVVGLLTYIRTLKGMYRVVVARYRKPKTNPQLAFIFGQCYPLIGAGILEAWGETLTDDEVHHYCKNEYLKRPVVNHTTGEEMGYTNPSLAKLNVNEMSDYITDLVKLGAMLGVKIKSNKEVDLLAGNAGVPNAGASSGIRADAGSDRPASAGTAQVEGLRDGTPSTLGHETPADGAAKAEPVGSRHGVSAPSAGFETTGELAGEVGTVPVGTQKRSGSPADFSPRSPAVVAPPGIVFQLPGCIPTKRTK